MKLTLPILTLASTALLGGCATMGESGVDRIGNAVISNSSGQPIGTARFDARGDDVELSISLTGLLPGPHGVHLHMTGACNLPDFTSAGGHLNPLNRKHGALAPGGKHEGDLPNIDVAANGTGSLTADLDGSRGQISEWLFDADGTALVVHAGPDDYRSDPAGNSGARIACGVVKPA